MKLYMFRTARLSIIRSLFTEHSVMVYVILVCRQLSSGTRMKPIASCKPDTQPTALHQTNNLKTKAPNTTGSNHLYNNLELLMMGIMVSETCRASNKIYNKETICCI